MIKYDIVMCFYDKILVHAAAYVYVICNVFLSLLILNLCSSKKKHTAEI